MFRNRRWKLAFIFLLVFGLSVFFAYRADSAAEASWIDRLSYRLTSPISKNLRKAYYWIENKTELLFQAAQIQSKNQILKKENAQLRQELILLEEFKDQTSRVNSHYQKLGLETAEATVAQVVSFDVRSAHQSLLINAGVKDGVEIQQTVVAHGGLVGRVIKVAPHYAQVLLITDPRSRVDVLEKESRARGTLTGKKKSLRLSTEYFSTQADYFSAETPLKKGQVLITTGQDEIFPKGIPVGTLQKIQRDPRGIFWQAEVVPVANLHRLEEVLVLKNRLKKDYEVFYSTSAN